MLLFLERLLKLERIQTYWKRVESIECNDCALTCLLALLASHPLPLKSCTHTHPHTCRDKWLIAVYSAVFVIVATVNLVMFVYLLVAVVIEVCTCMYQYRATILGGTRTEHINVACINRPVYSLSLHLSPSAFPSASPPIEGLFLLSQPSLPAWLFSQTLALSGPLPSTDFNLHCL